MPTGYTCYIEDGRITTGKDFLKLCLRNFGIYSEYRDEPLSTTVPTVFDVPNRYVKAVTLARVAVLNARKISIEDAKAEMKACDINEMAATRAALTEQLAIRKRYEDITLEIADWVPPTDTHNAIKQFAISQIAECVEYVDNYIQILSTKQFNFDYSDTAVLAYIQRRIDVAEDELEYAEKCLTSASERAAEKTKYVQQFLESFK